MSLAIVGNDKLKNSYLFFLLMNIGQFSKDDVHCRAHVLFGQKKNREPNILRKYRSYKK
jgi:hypothetical protein